MTVTPASRLKLPDQTTPHQVTAFILSHPHGAYTDLDVANIVGYYFAQGPPLGVDPLLALAQVCHETGYLSSAWAARPNCNPAGIGVTGQPGAGVVFNSWHESVPAHLGRLLGYATLPTERTPLQQRAVQLALVWRSLPAERQGAAPTLADLTGKWGTDPFYGVRIAEMANRILAYQ